MIARTVKAHADRAHQWANTAEEEAGRFDWAAAKASADMAKMNAAVALALAASTRRR